MSGITTIQTSSNIATAFGAWSSFTQTLNDYRKGKAEQDAVVQAGANLAAAASALGSSQFAQTFSGIAGFATSAANFKADLRTYKEAAQFGDSRARNAAFVSLVGDAAGLAQAVASGMGAIAVQAGEVALVTAAASMGTAAGAVGAASAIVGFGMSTIYGIQDYFQELDNQLMRAKEWNDFTLDLGASNINGQSVIVMAGRATDYFTSSRLNGSAFVYDEFNTAGAWNSGVVLAMNGGTGYEELYGRDVISDVSAFKINLAAGASATIRGNDNSIYGGSSSYTRLYGYGNVVSLASNSGAGLDLFSPHANTTVYGVGNTIGLYASNNVVQTYGNTVWSANAGYSSGIHGNDNSIHTGAHSYTELYGYGNRVGMVDYSGSRLNLYSEWAYTEIYGLGNTIGIGASKNGVKSNGNTFTFSATGLNTDIYGDWNVINAAGWSKTTLFGWNNTFNAASNSGAQCDFASHSSGTVNGYGNTVGICGSDIYVNSSRNYINAMAGTSFALTGYGNVVYSASWSSSMVALVNEYASATVHGEGNKIYVTASHTDVTTDGNTINFSAGGFTSDIHGNWNVINAGGWSATTVSGRNNTINTPDNCGVTVNFTSNSEATVTGHGNTIGICGTGISVNSSGNNLSTVNGASVSVGGDGNNVYFGAGSSISNVGNSNTLVGSNGHIEIAVTGRPQVVSIYGDDNYITFNSADSSNVTVYVYGSRNVADVMSRPRVTFNGGDNTWLNAGGRDGGGAGADRGGSDRTGNVHVGDIGDVGPLRGTRDPAYATDSTDSQSRNLIAAMASYGADTSASSVFVSPAQNDPQMLLAASAD
ncbi:hypothetical protein [Caballeronia ptereochthonis]|uniref:Uncharacterized protein n=1 Tax=Caballeronia ptereochthonis TaxID=1777144 RepID=A0A158CA86_9BURK|nr:hypothetical protein [Caballeronia ptereochthonis]SAK79224.1 hypothetical protein AWB83_04153 [Caballeronia ptereochthonis]